MVDLHGPDNPYKPAAKNRRAVVRDRKKRDAKHERRVSHREENLAIERAAGCKDLLEEVRCCADISNLRPHLNQHDNVRMKESARVSQHERRTLMNAAGGSYSIEEWLALCAEYDDCCACCGAREPLTVDHVRPVHYGGSSDISNIQPLCRSCNSSKGAREIDYRKPK